MECLGIVRQFTYIVPTPRHSMGFRYSTTQEWICEVVHIAYQVMTLNVWYHILLMDTVCPTI